MSKIYVSAPYIGEQGMTYRDYYIGEDKVHSACISYLLNEDSSADDELRGLVDSFSNYTGQVMSPEEVTNAIKKREINE